MKCQRIRAAAAAFVLASRASSHAAPPQTPPPQGVLGLSASASVEVAKDLLAVTFSTTREGSDANAVQAQLKQALDARARRSEEGGQAGPARRADRQLLALPALRERDELGRAPAISGWQGSAELIVEGRDMAAIGQLTGRITTMTIARVAVPALARGEPARRGRRRRPGDRRFRAKAASYAKLFGYGGYAVREVTVATSEPQPGPVPMMRMQAAAREPPPRRCRSSRARRLVTATVNGTVQMK